MFCQEKIKPLSKLKVYSSMSFRKNIKNKYEKNTFGKRFNRTCLGLQNQ